MAEVLPVDEAELTAVSGGFAPERLVGTISNGRCTHEIWQRDDGTRYTLKYGC